MGIWVQPKLPPEQQIKVPLPLYESEITNEIHRLEQLYQNDPPFIDPVSAQNYQAIYEGHFKDLHQLSTSERTPQTCINWIGTWAEYRSFYYLLISSELIDSQFLDLAQIIRPNSWFSARCLFQKNPKTNKQVGDSLKNIRRPINNLRLTAMFMPFLQIASEHQGNVPQLKDTFTQLTRKDR